MRATASGLARAAVGMLYFFLPLIGTLEFSLRMRAYAFHMHFIRVLQHTRQNRRISSGVATPGPAP